MDKARHCVLIVDDEQVNALLLESALGDDYRVEVARNGFEAIEKVRTCAPDLILLDVIMPGINGFEVARVIKEEQNSCDIPIIFLTIMDTFEGESEGLEAGGIDYLRKPFNLKLLQLRVRNQLELKRKNDLIREQRDLVIRQKEELETSLARIRRLEGMISICMHCKSLRNANDSWLGIEQYFSEHTDAQFSHCICPTCHERHYTDKD